MGYEGVFPFNERGIVDSVVGTKMFTLQQKAMSGERLTNEEKDYVFASLLSNSYFKDSVPLLGVRLCFRKVLRKFWVKYKWGDISEIWSFDKMTIRRNLYSKHGIIRIIEVK